MSTPLEMVRKGKDNWRYIRLYERFPFLFFGYSTKLMVSVFYAAMALEMQRNAASSSALMGRSINEYAISIFYFTQ